MLWSLRLFLLSILNNLWYAVHPICFVWRKNFIANNLICYLSRHYCSYLLVLDRTNWRTNILTALLIPYIFFSLPSLVFNFLRWLQLSLLLSLSLALLVSPLLMSLVMQRRSRWMGCFHWRGSASLLHQTLSWYDITSIIALLYQAFTFMWL